MIMLENGMIVDFFMKFGINLNAVPQSPYDVERLRTGVQLVVLLVTFTMKFVYSMFKGTVRHGLV